MGDSHAIRVLLFSYKLLLLFSKRILYCYLSYYPNSSVILRCYHFSLWVLSPCYVFFHKLSSNCSLKRQIESRSRVYDNLSIGLNLRLEQHCHGHLLRTKSPDYYSNCHQEVHNWVDSSEYRNSWQFSFGFCINSTVPLVTFCCRSFSPVFTFVFFLFPNEPLVF